MNPYMYLFSRSDLSHAQQIVQTGHAINELTIQHPHDPGNFMVLCDAKDESDILQIADWLMMHGIMFHMFLEPDIGEYTAIATQPLRGDARKPMKKFKTKK